MKNNGKKIMSFALCGVLTAGLCVGIAGCKDDTGTRTLADMGAVLGTVGYQYVYKRFLADFWVGGGYAFGHAAETNYHHGFELWHWFGREYKNLAMSFSIRLGICF